MGPARVSHQSRRKQSQWPGGIYGGPIWDGAHSSAIWHMIIINFNLNSQVLAKVLITLRQNLREEKKTLYKKITNEI